MEELKKDLEVSKYLLKSGNESSMYCAHSSPCYDYDELRNTWRNMRFIASNTILLQQHKVSLRKIQKQNLTWFDQY